MLWIKAFHIIAMTCWFAALFYLPRLFVYHAMSEDQVSKDRFVIMERKLMRGIATPSMIVTLILGLWLLHYIPGYMSAPLDACKTDPGCSDSGLSPYVCPLYETTGRWHQ